MIDALIAELIADAGRGDGTGESLAFNSATLDERGAEATLAALAAIDDERGYLLLMLLLRDVPERVERLPAKRRAAILTAALGALAYLTDFGYLGSEGWDGPAAQALLMTGDVACPKLSLLLDDDRPAPLAGSEMATISALEHYRRRDYAARYLALLMGAPPMWAPDPATRDEHVTALRRCLRTRASRPKPRH